MTKKVIVIGGGPAGMMAAIKAAIDGAQVILLEKNEKLGKKLYITGKGRCNVTNAREISEFFNMVSTNSKFLYSGFYGYDNYMFMQFFEDRGVKLKTERGQRVFPVSDKSSDIIACFSKELNKLGVDIKLNTTVEKLMVKSNVCIGASTNRGELTSDNVIIATGGISYASTGSTGDGYRFAENTDHSIIEPVPSLVPMNLKGDWYRQLQGLSLRNISLTIKKGKKTVFYEVGEMLFSHFGVTGPLILKASSLFRFDKLKDMSMLLDLRPGLTIESLDKKILDNINSAPNKDVANSLIGLMPRSMIPVILKKAGVGESIKGNQLSKKNREDIVSTIKGFEFSPASYRGFNEAIITKGGVSTKDVNPSTMESKLVKNLYFAGEVLDLDALTGGFNIQIAVSTGFIAGESAAI